MFWYHPDTGERIVGLLNHSVIYDLPVFLAYLCIMPGMAVFLVRIETDFVDFYQKFYDAVRDGGSLDYLNEIRDEMVYAVRQGIFEIIKIQGITVLIVFIAGPSLLRWAGISELHLPLLYVQVVGASLQVVFLGLLNVFFYLDKRMIVMILTLVFVDPERRAHGALVLPRPGVLRLRLRGLAAHRRAGRRCSGWRSGSRASSTKPSCFSRARATRAAASKLRRHERVTPRFPSVPAVLVGSRRDVHPRHKVT